MAARRIVVSAESRGSAPARAALAGNPSDGYGGAVLALALPAFEAGAVARSAPRLAIEPHDVTLIAHTGAQEMDDAKHPASNVDRPPPRRQADVVEQLIGLCRVHLRLSDEVLQLTGSISQQVPPRARDRGRRAGSAHVLGILVGLTASQACLTLSLRKRASLTALVLLLLP